ncbi:MAG TPA: hypothetical protein VF260_00585 [Bacilli bacterium]
MMNHELFEDAYNDWLRSHLHKRSGERKGRLERGHQHAEKLFLQNVWWPLFGHFHHLHPEYEILDWRGRPYFLDFAWLPGHVKIAFEIKGFGPHVRDMDRKHYCYELNRETFLQSLGFRVVAIPYDDVAERPDLLVSLLRALLGQFAAVSKNFDRFTRIERDVLLLAMGMNKPVRPIEIAAALHINRRTAVSALQSLCRKGRLQAIYGGRATKVCRYEPVRQGLHNTEWQW